MQFSVTVTDFVHYLELYYIYVLVNITHLFPHYHINHFETHQKMLCFLLMQSFF